MKAIIPKNRLAAFRVNGLRFPAIVVIGLLVSLMHFALAGEAAPDDMSRVRKITDLSGKRIGIIAGTMLDIAANTGLDFTQIIYFDDQPTQLQALREGEIDAVVDDAPVMRFLASKYRELRRLEGSLQEDDYGFGLHYGDNALYTEVETALREILAEGTVAKLEKKWLDSPDDSYRVWHKQPAKSASERVLRFGTSPVSAPFSYLNDDNEVVGLDIELMDMVARRIGRRLVVIDMEFSQMIPALQAKKVDVIGSCLTITEDRRKLIRFTSPYYRGGVEAVVLRSPFGRAPEDR